MGAEFHIESLIEECKRTLVSKKAEYARGTDRFHNFNKAARIRGNHPIEALRGMQLKHTVSVDDICEGVVRGEFPSEEMLREKFGDEINYLLLCYALIIQLKREVAE